MTAPHPPSLDNPTLQSDTTQPHLASAHLTTSTLPSLLQEPNNPPTTLSSSNLLTTSLKPTTITALSSTPHTPLTTSLAHSLLLDTLTQHPASIAAVIDTTGNFDVVGLYARILKRGSVGADVATKDHRSSDEKQDQESNAVKTLDRVRIMRVFNLEGMGEAVAEVRGGMSVAGVREESPVLRRRTEVADSEEEEEDEDEEMLFDVPGSTEREAPSASAHLRSRTGSSGQRTGNRQPPPLKVKFLLVDNLAQVLVPLLKKDSVEANAAATTLLATLSDLTRTHNLHTLLLNPFTTPPTTWPIQTIPPPPPTTSTTPAPQQQNHGYNPPPLPQGPSVFSSQRNVPPLVGLLSRYVDTHLLLSSLPRAKLDARVYYGEAGGGREGREGGGDGVGG
ncbi:hypothetical protein EKO04_011131 [Ascochyta lentis]|uniref:DNA recombination and repair protein Rad51-like C-terminal domain-containing protein n=1 Tax=Ascochyta lentis TaxID=205686 RepID=A0A8H7IUT8_9PLEO|nr:hypothetical protein EKO04_011131 [Ascochyta lentis]